MVKHGRFFFLVIDVAVAPGANEAPLEAVLHRFNCHVTLSWRLRMREALMRFDRMPGPEDL